MSLNNLTIDIINSLYKDNFEFYQKLRDEISQKIIGRICHHNVLVLNIIVNFLNLNIRTYLEIGTHNGCSMSYVVNQTRLPIDCYGIDLFKDTLGHYKKDKLLLSNTLNNIQKNNVSNSSINLIQGNSTNPSTLSVLEDRLGSKRIDLLFIDGDHSYKGIKLDFENYSTFLSDNAIIIFDDYNSKWPGVIQYCDELILSSNSGITKIGLFNNNELVMIKND